MMQGTGGVIGVALRKFCKAVIGRCKSADPEDHWQMWKLKAYPETLKALRRLHYFKGKGGADRADAYICGYMRGLCDARELLGK